MITSSPSAPNASLSPTIHQPGLLLPYSDRPSFYPFGTELSRGRPFPFSTKVFRDRLYPVGTILFRAFPVLLRLFTGIPFPSKHFIRVPLAADASLPCRASSTLAHQCAVGTILFRDFSILLRLFTDSIFPSEHCALSSRRIPP
jgi:hypothetical protein